MSARVKPSRPATAGKRVPTISAEQIQAIARPGAISWLCLETAAPVPAVVGRPQFEWRDNLDIARQLNDYFARDAEH
ncbi:MAG: hypothetical protein V4444_03255 [Pseudomonadota bacterium]